MEAPAFPLEAAATIGALRARGARDELGAHPVLVGAGWVGAFVLHQQRVETEFAGQPIE